MKNIAKFIYFSFILVIMSLQISVFAEPQVQYIERWKNDIAYNSRNEVITDCVAYDYLTNNTNKFVKLDTEGKEIARFDTPDQIAENNEQGILQELSSQQCS